MIRVRTIIMSHLSDSQEEMGIKNFESRVNHRLNFVKYLVLSFEDVNKKVDADAVYKEFKKKHPNL